MLLYIRFNDFVHIHLIFLVRHADWVRTEQVFLGRMYFGRSCNYKIQKLVLIVLSQINQGTSWRVVTIPHTRL